MKQYAGKYELQCHQNFGEYMKKITPFVDGDMISLIDEMENQMNTIELQVEGDYLTILTDGFTMKFIIGEPCNMELFPGFVSQCTSAYAGNVLTIAISTTGVDCWEKQEVREIIFTKDGLKITYAGEKTNIVAWSTYTKIR